MIVEQYIIDFSNYRDGLVQYLIDNQDTIIVKDCVRILNEIKHFNATLDRLHEFEKTMLHKLSSKNVITALEQYLNGNEKKST
jgi:hypothetical protein